MARTSTKARKPKRSVDKTKTEKGEKSNVEKEDQQESDASVDVEEKDSSTDNENEDTTSYEVEKIVHTRIYRGKRQYLIRWKGYNEESDTWEPESALESSTKLLEAFKKENLVSIEETNDDESSDDNESLQKKITENVKEAGSKKKNKKDEVPVTEYDSEQPSSDSEQDEISKKSKSKKKITENFKEAGSKKKNKKDEVPLTEDDSEQPSSDSGQDEISIKSKSKKKTIKGNKVVAEKRTNNDEHTALKSKKKKKSDEEDDESLTDGKDYEVEKILDVHFRKDRKREFLIRWKGYRGNDDTWEPEEHLNCEQLIEKFMEKVEQARNSTQRELREREVTKRFVPYARKGARSLRNFGMRPCYQESF